MAVVARKVMGTYQCRCSTCGEQWISETEDGGPEREEHRH